MHCLGRVIPLLLACSLFAQSASATVRPGAGNVNNAYICTAPHLGLNCTAQVATSLQAYGAVYGFTGAATIPYSGYTVLVDPNSAFVLYLPLQFSPSSTWTYWFFSVPNNPALSGLAIKTQGALFSFVSISSFALTNAVDLVVGT